MKLRFLSQFLIAISLILGIFLPFGVFAVSPSSILMKAVPENPSPGQNTTITLSSYGSNLDSVLISWFVDGKNIVSTIGKKSFSITAPSSGEENTIKAVLAFADGEIEKTITLRPANVLLLWQAEDSYIPPFYKGKALATPDSAIKIVAMPEIKDGKSMVNPKNMVYEWKQDYSNMPSSSGYGKNYFSYTNDYLESMSTISVVASTTDQKYSSQSSIEVGTTEAKILFYKNDTNMGTIWENALKNGHNIEDNTTLEAAPYFISPKDIRIPTLVWNWYINNNKIETPIIKKNILPLKVQEGTSGTSTITLNIENKYRIFGTASAKIDVTF